MKRISLGLKEYEELVSGKVVESNGVQIILQDIGYDKMLDIITKLKQEPWKN